LDQLQERKRKATEENNVMVYNSIVVYEKMGVVALLDIIEQQWKQIKELESEIVVIKNVNNSI
jgi:CRISPR/Cas system-associated protein endoribonuclease Cas2